jgi:L-arabinose isomerase
MEPAKSAAQAAVPTVGLFGVGLDTYWPQFSGLKSRLEGYQARVADFVRAAGPVDLVDAGLVDSPERAAAAGALFREKSVDLLFLYISTYALSSTVLPVVKAAGVPTVVLNVQPKAAIDYAAFNALGDRGKMTGDWLANCQACSVPEVANVLGRAGLPYSFLTGHLEDGRVGGLIADWVRAAAAVKTLRENRLGLMGHYYGGMLDVYTDVTRQLAAFGGHAELVEIDELAARRAAATPAAVAAKLAEFGRVFRVAPECGAAELERAARTSVALDALVAAHRLGSLAYYYEGSPGSVHEDVITSVIAGNTLLTGSHVPVAGEYEVKNVQAMKILDAFGAGGSFSEFYALDFDADVVLLGHDGPAHFAVADGPVGLVPLPVYHGKPGKGLSIQMSVKRGPATVLAVADGPEGLFLLAAEGECVSGPTLQIGNTNSRYRFPVGAAEFIERWSAAGPSHHCAVGVGHLAARLEKFAKLAGVGFRRIG